MAILGVEFYALALLLIKHWLADFPLQRPWNYQNKGTYGHPGGIAHALCHGGLTLLVFLLCGATWEVAASLCTLDTVLHYHIDWAKVKIGQWRRWSAYVQPDPVMKRDPVTHEKVFVPRRAHLAIYSDGYFQALGVDQLAHHLTYVLLVASFMGQR